jgi:hypothetical protein
MQYTKRITIEDSKLIIAYSIKWKSFPGDDGKYYESEDVRYIRFNLQRGIFSTTSNNQYRGCTILGIHAGIGTKTQTEKII